MQNNNDTAWSLTVQLGDPSGRKLTTESLLFASRERALQQLAQFSDAGSVRKSNLYVIENERGEQISFAGEHFISYSLHEWTPTTL